VDGLASLAPTAIGVGILILVATAALLVFGVRAPWTPALAIARGVVQLAAISLILGGIITSALWIALALLVMFAVAVAVATRRIGRTGRDLVVMATSIAAGVGTAAAAVFGSGALEATPRYALAIGAIVIGNTMNIATLTGRHLATAVSDHWDEVEGWLALGATPRRATRDLARRAVREALIPSIDQTKTTGLVVLPGAFVGAIFGGLSPLDAGRFQIIVLAAIMAAGAVTAVLVATWQGAVALRVGPPD
jgi:putative ABC transport system permease protein